jgi:hypothetical protein
VIYLRDRDSKSFLIVPVSTVMHNIFTSFALNLLTLNNTFNGTLISKVKAQGNVKGNCCARYVGKSRYLQALKKSMS